ncbi:hypothetical protein [Candidatus Galacturonibacter soehngenii]|uniref:Uncharacterized protein n=1 Tax=Candidatus Galacturonatibacter soehngenii TaxID=2307010 RepID=A0A7V7QNC0_9FIRM|nr:hypothetical protein [Candidatus Galacturonibacter soehngenii]KAB1440183.1 hypothetical protein F7O84_07355 [Candidatus Galacturonibacter soehngenii]
MGQEDYLNNLLNSIVDGKEESKKTEKKEEEMLADALTSEKADALKDEFTDSEEGMEDVFADTKEEALIDVFADTEEEGMEDVFADTEEEALIDVFADTEEEGMEDVFADAEEEGLVDIFADTEEEEGLVDVFADTNEDEVLEDVIADTKEEGLVDVFVNTDEEVLEDVITDTKEEEGLIDVFADNQEEELLEDISVNEGETVESDISIKDEEDINNETVELEKESDTLLNSIDDILGSLDTEVEEGATDRVEEESNESNEEDIFAVLGESQDSIEVSSQSEDFAEQSLFDDDLMKLLGEEDLSGEEVFLSVDETEAELAKDKDAKAQETKSLKNDKKPGLFAKLFKNNEESSNDQPLEEITAKEKKKKEKKVKPPKEKKAKKEKKPKKPKVKKPEIIEEPSVPLHKGQVIAIFVLCISIVILIISGSNLIPYSISISTAKGYYEREEYTKAYYELEGLEIQKKDLTFYNKLQTIMFLKNQLDSFYTYERIGLNQEALSALLKGVSKYDEHYARAQQYGADAFYDRILGQIEKELTEKYNVSLEMARTINLAEDATSYSVQIKNITNNH